MYNVSNLITTVNEFISNSDDDEAVELVSTLYLVLLELSNELGKLQVEYKLLERDFNCEFDDEVGDGVEKAEPDYAA